MDEQINIPVVDSESALNRLDGDKELYLELIELYLDDTPKQIEILQTAIEDGDDKVIERQAHSIKSASANVGLERVRNTAFAIEEMGRATSLGSVPEKFKQLKQDFSEAQDALRDLAKDLA